MRRIGENALACSSGREFALESIKHQASIKRVILQDVKRLAFEDNGEMYFLLPELDEILPELDERRQYAPGIHGVR